MGTIKNARRKTKWDKIQADLQDTREYSKHLLERITIIENAINWMLRPRCLCGSREVTRNLGVNSDLTSTYKSAEIRCFYCHRLLEAYGARG